MDKELNIFEKAANFAKAAVKHVAAGMPKVTDEQLKIRLDVCTKCGCNLKIKASWATQDCPIKKWPAIT